MEFELSGSFRSCPVLVSVSFNHVRGREVFGPISLQVPDGPVEFVFPAVFLGCDIASFASELKLLKSENTHVAYLRNTGETQELQFSSHPHDKDTLLLGGRLECPGGEKGLHFEYFPTTFPDGHIAGFGAGFLIAFSGIRVERANIETILSKLQCYLEQTDLDLTPP